MGEEPLSAVEYPLVEYGRQDSFLFGGADVSHDGIGGRDCWEVSYRNFGGTVIVATADIGIGGLQADDVILISFISFEIAVLYFSVTDCVTYKPSRVFDFIEIAVSNGTIDDLTIWIRLGDGTSFKNFIFQAYFINVTIYDYSFISVCQAPEFAVIPDGIDYTVS